MYVYCALSFSISPTSYFFASMMSHILQTGERKYLHICINKGNLHQKLFRLANNICVGTGINYNYY